MISKEEYRRALVEVLEIIKYLPENDRSLISKMDLKKMELEKDQDYYFSLDRTKPWEKQVKEETKAILAHIFKKYLATSEELKVINEMERKNRYLLDKQKKNKNAAYNGIDFIPFAYPKFLVDILIAYLGLNLSIYSFFYLSIYYTLVLCFNYYFIKIIPLIVGCNNLTKSSASCLFPTIPP